MYLTCLFIESKKTTKNRIEKQQNSLKIKNKNNVVSEWIHQREEFQDKLEILLTVSSFCKKKWKLVRGFRYTSIRESSVCHDLAGKLLRLKFLQNRIIRKG